jgi:hypothetical protein
MPDASLSSMKSATCGGVFTKKLSRTEDLPGRVGRAEVEGAATRQRVEPEA